MSEFRDRLSRYKACMLLGGVGDALGYNDGKWEFCSSGEKIQEEARSAGGVSAIRPTSKKMRVSDDTVMHLATAEAVLTPSDTHEQLYCNLAAAYKQAMRDMDGRSPGVTCTNSVRQFIPEMHMYSLPFNPRGGGCGAATRAVPIGLLYWRPEEIESLVRVAVEAGRMTHNHPTGFLGSVAVAVLVSYAVQGKEVREWGEGLLHTLPLAKRYCEQQKRDWEEIQESWSYFEDQWRNYLNIVMPSLGKKMKDMSAYEYDQFTLKLSYSGVPGSSGHDAPIIAYDALLRSIQGSPTSRWEKLCRYGMFHGGDSDSTGIIAGACYGAMFGLEGVPPNNYSQLECRDRLEKLGKSLYSASLSDSLVKSKLGEAQENTTKVVSFPSRKWNESSTDTLTRSDDSFSASSSFRRGRASHRKRVTFKDQSPVRGKVGPDLFSLASMRLGDCTETKRTEHKSILKQRSRSLSPTRSSEYRTGLSAIEKPNQQMNFYKDSHFHKRASPDSTQANRTENSYPSTSKSNKNFAKRVKLPVDFTFRGIAYPPRTSASRIPDMSSTRLSRPIKYPPQYEMNLLK